MGSIPKLKIPVFVALDVDSDIAALAIAEKVREYVGGFKVGPRLTYKYGSSFVKELAKMGLVFVDNKYHDIPSTVLAAIRASFESGATFATVHASNGLETLKKIAEIEYELSKTRPFKILSVTALTSFTEKTMPANWVKEPMLRQVEMLAGDAVAAGLTGLVCSPEEVATLKKKYPNNFLVTPGIRLHGGEKADQTRVMSPRDAILAGASALVIGRPIVEAANPEQAAQKILHSLN